jgi:preprotein translocase SecE subunit
MKTYLIETKEELHKVTWPSKNNVIMVTVAVVLISVITGYFLGLFDYLFAQGLLKILNK